MTGRGTGPGPGQRGLTVPRSSRPHPWLFIDRKRAAEGWRPVARMGQVHHTPAVTLSGGLAALAANNALANAALSAAGENLHGGRASEAFDRRQPEHIYLASTIGMGRFD